MTFATTIIKDPDGNLHYGTPAFDAAVSAWLTGLGAITTVLSFGAWQALERSDYWHIYILYN